MLLTDILELKTMLDLGPEDKLEDRKLLLLIERASNWIEEDVLGRGDLSLKQRTEYYWGTGTRHLPLRHRPVYRDATHALTVNEDEGGCFGSPDGSFDAVTSLLDYGDDYALDFDGDEAGVSRSGILVRLTDVWPRPPARERGTLSPFIGPGMGNVRVTYFGGYTDQTLPAIVRGECNDLVARMRLVLPLGAVLSSESYEQRSVSYAVDSRKDFLLGPTKKALGAAYRNTWFAAR